MGGEVEETMPPVERLLDPLLRLLGGCGEAEKPREGKGGEGRREEGEEGEGGGLVEHRGGLRSCGWKGGWGGVPWVRAWCAGRGTGMGTLLPCE